jgi:steroid delta-isomerase-like uncharacterized protein
MRSLEYYSPKKQKMKKLILLLFVGASVFVSKNAHAQKKHTEANNLKFYARVWDVVVNEGRTNILDTAFAEDVVLHHTKPETKGKAGAIAYYSNYVTGFSDRKFTVVESFAKGEKLVKYWRFTGTHTGVFFGIPATGKKVDLIGCTITKMVDGKITEENDFFDNLEFLQQLGLIPR